MIGASCPCCGRSFAADGDLMWNMNARTLTGRGHSARIPLMRAKIFNVLWTAWPKGVGYSQNQMMDLVYAEYADGGPESRNIISVQMLHLKKQIAAFDLTIKSYSGYRLIDLTEEKREAA